MNICITVLSIPLQILDRSLVAPIAGMPESYAMTGDRPE
jgi:hypothetical protein